MPPSVIFRTSRASSSSSGGRTFRSVAISRTPLPVALDVAPIRLPAVVEETLWFVACEALANTVKHAGARTVRVEVRAEHGTVRLRCGDDGRGGADPSGTGLRGIADRTEAAGGRFRLYSPAGQGTTIDAELQCGS